MHWNMEWKYFWGKRENVHESNCLIPPNLTLKMNAKPGHIVVPGFAFSDAIIYILPTSQILLINYIEFPENIC